MIFVNWKVPTNVRCGSANCFRFPERLAEAQRRVTQLPCQDPAGGMAMGACSGDLLSQAGLEGLQEDTGTRRPLVT